MDPSNPPPTLDGFTSWVYTAMGVPEAACPGTTPWLGYAFDVAMAIVNQQLNQIAGPIYMFAVYNLGGDNLVNWALDQPGVYYPSPPAPVNTPYFQYLRTSMNINAFVPGIIQQSSDVSTAQSMLVLQQYKGYTLGNLQSLKTPWGRTYLSFAASVGTLWGIS